MLLTSDTPVRANGTVLTTAERRGQALDRRAVASFFDGPEDCARVATCVNVCVGVPTETLTAPLVPDLVVALMDRATGRKVLIDREEYTRLINAAQALSDAAGYINCSGPLVDRIRVMQTEHGRTVLHLEAENERLRRALGFYATPENWYPGDDEDVDAAIDLDTDAETVELFIVGGCGVWKNGGRTPVSGARARAALAASEPTEPTDAEVSVEVSRG